CRRWTGVKRTSAFIGRLPVECGDRVRLQEESAELRCGPDRLGDDLLGSSTFCSAYRTGDRDQDECRCVERISVAGRDGDLGVVPQLSPDLPGGLPGERGVDL